MWLELRLSPLPRAWLDQASARLFALGAAGLQESWVPGTAPPIRQPWDPPERTEEADPLLLIAWFEDPDVTRLTIALEDLPVEPRWKHVEEADWESTYRAAFGPLEISPRLTIAPPWNAPPGALVIEPGQGFGTGHHPTTRQALQAVDRICDEGPRTLLDVGTGSGILALAAARRGLAATGIDVDPAAIRDAERQAARNGLSATFSTTPLGQVPGVYDVVVANVHAEALVALRPALLARTGGWLILAGILDDREEGVRSAFDGFVELADRDHTSGWICLQYKSTP